jgi:hypothetical protein
MIRIHQRKYNSPGTRIASTLSGSPLVTILATRACQRRSSYTVPGFRAVSSQAAVTRLASLKRAPISADSLGENLVFGKSANDKKVPDRVDSDPYIEVPDKSRCGEMADATDLKSVGL